MSTGCGPRARIPVRPGPVPEVMAATEGQARLARALAPTLYLQRDETFRLERVVAVVHPARNVVAYHLLWRDDVHGAWIPFTVPTDQEVVWVGHDGAGRPTDIWTYWHGKVLHRAVGVAGDTSHHVAIPGDTAHRAPAPGGGAVVLADGGTPIATLGAALPVEVNVQWGKHGSIPRGTTEYDYPMFRSLPTFYVLHWIGLPDIWLSNIMRKGPWCFCHGYRRYREFTRPVPLGERLDAVAATEKPGPVLKATFGDKYSDKRPWPWSKK
jgi:hypothetical protein